jgi:hypothetical protein
VAIKQQELATLLPTEIVMLDSNFQEYGVDVEYNKVIPKILDHPTLVVNFFNPTHTRMIYPDQFETELYEYLV